MDQWNRLNANIDGEVHARPFDDTHLECHNEWDLVGPDGVAYQDWEGDCLSAPTMCALRRQRQGEMIIRALKFPDGNGPAVPFGSGSCQLRSETNVPPYDNAQGYSPLSPLAPPPSSPQSRVPLGKPCVVEDGMSIGSNVRHDVDEMMGAPPSTGESRILAPNKPKVRIYSEKWTEGRIYWWKDRLPARPMTNEADTPAGIVTQEWIEEWKTGRDGNCFAEGEEKTM